MIEKPDKLNNQAIILASDGNYAEAIACFKRAIIIEGNNSLLWYNLGITYRDAGDLENANNSFVKAHNIEPENQDVLEALATNCLMQNQLKETMDYCYEGLRINIDNAHFWNLLGIANFKSEDFGTACDAFETAVILNPYYEDALYNLRDTYAELRNKAGVSECQKRLNELK